MKKMVFMAAFVAACAAFVACSSDDDLVQQKPDVPEESVEEGIPMTVKVADLASRGTDITTATLEGFTLYSTMTDAWKTGKPFGKDAGGNWTTNTDLAWPDKKTYTFFGITDVANLADLDSDSHKDVPVVTAYTCSFNYAMPISLKPGTDDEYYYNSEDLKDLLVAKTTCSSESGDPKGTLEVDFQHALAQIKAINVYCNAANMVEGDVPLWRFRVNSIKLGGLKTVGTYTYDATTPWGVSGDDAEFEIPLDIPTNDETAFNRMSFVPGAKDKIHAKDENPLKTTVELPLTDGGLYVIPQSVEGKLVLKSGFYELEGAYAEMELQAAQDDEGSVVYYCWDINMNDGLGLNWDWESSKTNGYQKVRVPLTFDISGGSGKGYTLVIDLTRAICVETGEGSYRGVGDLVLGESIDIQI